MSEGSWSFIGGGDGARCFAVICPFFSGFLSGVGCSVRSIPSALRDFLVRIDFSIRKGCGPWRGHSLITSVIFIGAVNFCCEHGIIPARLNGYLCAGAV